ncbi:hypothetical protein PRUPE_2G206700 [Prunus persica]|uniref:Uncharacterized protein n=1 Tax=Prunus persica TaxID=3760 RepID=A0A251QJ61_PRUPE|nr:hypothetical protein PRUPE_2G206700 [Prunus persica]
MLGKQKFSWKFLFLMKNNVKTLKILEKMHHGRKTPLSHALFCTIHTAREIHFSTTPPANKKGDEENRD